MSKLPDKHHHAFAAATIMMMALIASVLLAPPSLVERYTVSWLNDVGNSLLPSSSSCSTDTTSGGRRSVNLNFFPPSNAARADMWSGQGGLIMARSILWAAGKTGGAVRVYYVHAEPSAAWAADVTSKITSYMAASYPTASITVYADAPGAPNISTLTTAAYDVALVSSDASPGSAWFTYLHAFAAAGGGIVLTTFSNASQKIPSFDYANYTPIPSIAGNQSIGSSIGLDTTSIVSHFITTGLTSFNAGTAGYGSKGQALNAGAANLARYTDGTTLIAVQSFGGGDTPDFIRSSTVLASRHQTAVATLLPNKTFSLLYRASRDGYTAAAFHSKCDGKSPLFIVIKSTSGYIGTVYTNVPFKSVGNYVSGTAGACWMNNLESSAGVLSTVKAYNTAAPQYTIYDNASYGPTFGGGHDLFVSNTCTVAHSCYTNPYSYAGFANSTMFGAYNWAVSEMEIYLVGG
jgi:hypothetical protein